MLKQYVPGRDIDFPLHATGEVVLVKFGNYLESGLKCQQKERPAIILASNSPQHFICGLTTQARCKITGEARVELPYPSDLGLQGGRRSYLWSPYAARLCRLDVLRHLGWVDLDTVELLRRSMHMPRWIYTGLLQAAASVNRIVEAPR